MSTAVSSDVSTRSSNHAAMPAAAVTITVQIAVPNDVLPLTARRLVNDLRNLAEAVTDISSISEQRSVSEYQPGETSDRHTSVSTTSVLDEPPLRLVGSAQRPRASGEASHNGPTLCLETDSRTVRRDGVSIHLSRREYDLLSYLCRNPRRVFGRAQLLRNVWGYEMVGGERTVDVHVRRLRAKLGSCADGIVTVRGVGYRFDDQATVSVVVKEE